MSAALPPVLLVHGIWDSGHAMRAIHRHLDARGRRVEAIDLRPNDGRAPIRTLADQVHQRVEVLRATVGAESVDLVGFSMGALVARTYLQLLGGKHAVRTFISISGPHRGTFGARLLPLAGVRDMRPGSDLLRELERDPDPWGACRVHVLYTPYDVMIVPAHSSELAGAHSTTRIPVPIHRLMVHDRRVLERVSSLLAGSR